MNRSITKAENLAEKVAKRRKLLADEYGIFTDEELTNASNETKRQMDYFVAVFGKSQDGSGDGK